MRYNLLIYLSMLLPACLQGQGFSIDQEIKEDSIRYYANNTNYCPYYVQIQAQIDSVAFGEAHSFVIEAQTKHKRIIAYAKPNKAGKIDYVVSGYFGSPYTKPDSSYIYTLPYAPKTGYRIIQGYKGRFSHKNQYALDFRMPIGTPIHAVRSGVVVRVKDDSDKHGRTMAFAQFGNHIIIYHEDGTLGYYYHISKDGSKVKVGDTVQQKQFIALSGNTGWSTTPHLHFIVKYTSTKGYESLPTWFCTSQKSRTYLKAKHKYLACE